MPGNTAKKTTRRRPVTGAARDGDLDRAQLARLLTALNAMRDGNFRRRLPVAGEGLVADLTFAYNEIADRQQHILSELTRVQRIAGREGRGLAFYHKRSIETAIWFPNHCDRGRDGWQVP